MLSLQRPIQPLSTARCLTMQAGMLTRALDTRVAEAAQLRKALELAKREAARMHAEMDELRQASPAVGIAFSFVEPMKASRCLPCLDPHSVHLRLT